MEPFPACIDIGALIDEWRQDCDRSPYTAILLRRIYCDQQHPMPKGAEWYERAAVMADRVQCMREREGYDPPRDAPVSKRFASAAAYAAGYTAASRAALTCRRCHRSIAEAVRSVCGDLPRVVFCECGRDRLAARRMNAELVREDAASRSYWSSVDTEAVA